MLQIERYLKMKIRNGFVSNSSSSSFVLVITKDEYDKIRNEKEPLDQAIMNAVMYSSKVLGTDCMVYENFSDHGGCGPFNEFDCSEVVEAAKKLAKEQNKLVCSDEDFPTDLTEQDDWLRDVVSDGLHEVQYNFKNVPKDKKWSHSQDW